MWSKRDTLIFLAGAFAFHAFSHLTMHFAHMLPVTFYGITLTYSLNLYATVASTLIAIVFLWWASRAK